MRIPTLSEAAGSIGSRSLKEWLVLLLIIVPAIVEAAYIQFFGVNVAWWDQWDFVPYIEQMFQHNLSISDLFSQHNEHRLFFPRIIMLVLAYISNYNNLYEMYFSWILALLTLAAIFLMYKSSFGSSAKALTAFVPISFLIFNLGQYENILWGFQIQVYLGVMGFVLCIYLLNISKKLDKYFALAACSSILATFSFANGLAAWPAGLFFILISGKGKRSASAWCLIGLSAAALYFLNWTKPTGNAKIQLIMENPFKNLLFLVSSIGSPLGLTVIDSVFFGIILIIILIVELFLLKKYGLINANAKWLALIAYSFISSLAMTLFRGGLGVSQSLASRYITITTLAVIGIYILTLVISNMEPEKKINRLLKGAVLLILIIGLIIGNINGLMAGLSLGVSKMDQAQYLTTYKSQSDGNLSKLYPNPEVVRERAPILEKYRLNVFSYGLGYAGTSSELSSTKVSCIRKMNEYKQKYISNIKYMLLNINKKYS